MVGKPDISSKLLGDDSKILRVRTNLHAGIPATKNIKDTVMFALLEALQKPTDCLYSVICKQSEGDDGKF